MEGLTEQVPWADDRVTVVVKRDDAEIRVGGTVVVVSHAELRRMCRRILEIIDGGN